MIQHRTFPPAPPAWAPTVQRGFPAPLPAGSQRGLATIPAPRPPVGVLPPPGPPPAGLPYPVPAGPIGPRLVWVGLAWSLFGVLVLVGVATFVAGSPASGTGPARFFGSGEVVTLELDPTADPLVYAALDAGGYVTCEPAGRAADDLLLTPTATDWSVTVAGREWHAAFHLAPAAAGTYQIRCEGVGATFAVGDQTEGTSLGDARALLVLPLVGFVPAVSTTIVVLLRRRAAQDRLSTAWTGAPAGPVRRW